VSEYLASKDEGNNIHVVGRCCATNKRNRSEDRQRTMGLEPQTRSRVLAIIGVIALALVQLHVASGHSVAGDDRVAQLHTSFSSDKSGNVEISVGDQAWLKSHDTCVVHHGDLLCSSNGGLVLAPSGRYAAATHELAS
jgi:hypothetical protein